jgi:hypothetical protein
MSATPTDDALIVALDFEGLTIGSRFRLVRADYYKILGVDSVERSPQEDMLLVLFNTAISNLVS